ncbi:MAG: sterol desaturase family protein [Gammaproteobacteria bacterium]|nr:sterol desaturase family protein [Gammaproteobacteria bacterium]
MDNVLRLSFAVGIFAVMIAWEAVRPRRVQLVERKQRWPVNLGLALGNMMLMRFTIGGLAYLSALWAQENGVGLLAMWPLPTGINVLATLLILDFAIYVQHIAMHKIPVLWRLHKVHHTDLEFDATTAVRFHPVEIVLSMLYKSAWIVAIGGHPGAVIAFEIILNGCATFNHSNVAIPEAIDRKLRWLLITPDMHRIHHSAEPVETDSNYGFSVSWWDRLCRTYTDRPKLAQDRLMIGLTAYREQSGLSFVRLLLMPFAGQRIH